MLCGYPLRKQITTNIKVGLFYDTNKRNLMARRDLKKDLFGKKQ